MYDKILVGTTTTWMKREFITESLDMFVKEEVGNFIQLWPALQMGTAESGRMYQWNESGDGDPWDEWVKICAENKIYTQFCHIRPGNDKLEQYASELGKYFLGYNVAECEGLVAWPYDTRKDFLPEKVDNLVDAKNIYLRYVDTFIRERVGSLFGTMPIWAINQGRLRGEEKEGGIDNSMAELFAGDNFETMLSIERGMHRSLKTDIWGAYFAVSYFGGIRQEDLIRRKRNRLAMYNAYMAGADVILIEGGVFHNDRGSTNVVRSFGPEMDARFNDASCRTLRSELKKFYAFTKTQKRLSNGPVTKVAFIKGHLDGFVGSNSVPAPLRSWYIYGQYQNEPFKSGNPERMWDILSEINSNVNWDNRYEYAQEEKSLSGSLPYGQYDVIDIGTDKDVLQNYDLLVFLGWNTMTEENYKKIVEYVRAGGDVVMAAPHLAVNIRREEEWEFVNDGDISELCGARIAGKGSLLKNLAYIEQHDCPYDLPYLEYGRHAGFEADQLYSTQLELTTAKVVGENLNNRRLQHINDSNVERLPFVLYHKLGKGSVTLMNTWDYPGDEGLYPIYSNIIRKACEHHFQKSLLKVICRNKVKWSVYTENNSDKVGSDFTQLFILNTDYDLPQHIIIKTPKIEFEWVLKPCEFRSFFVWQDLFYTLNVPAEMKIENGAVNFYSQTDKLAMRWDSKTKKDTQITLK